MNCVPSIFDNAYGSIVIPRRYLKIPMYKYFLVKNSRIGFIDHQASIKTNIILLDCKLKCDNLKGTGI